MKIFRPVYTYFQLDQLKAPWMIPLLTKLLINKSKLKACSCEAVLDGTDIAMQPTA